MSAQVGFLVWDSNFFGLKTGRVGCQGGKDASLALAEARRKSYKLVYAFSQEQLGQALLDEFSGIDVDGQVTHSKSAHDCELLKKREHAMDDFFQIFDTSPALQELALYSGIFSRFRLDANLPPGSFERMYEKWLLNSLRDTKNSCVYVKGSTLEPLGLVTASWESDSCNIGLLAVHPTFQGQGIGNGLLQLIEEESSKRGATSIGVTTQLSNHNARRLYEKRGYEERKIRYISHFHWEDSGE